MIHKSLFKNRFTNWIADICISNCYICTFIIKIYVFKILIKISFLSPIRRGFTSGFVNYIKRGTWLTAASDKAYQLLVHGQWFFPGTPASSTTKTGHHRIAEILLKIALNAKNHIKIIVLDITDFFFLLSFRCTQVKEVLVLSSLGCSSTYYNTLHVI